MTIATKNILTVPQVASRLKITDGAVRLLCIKHGVGTKLGRDRLLTYDDLKRLRDIRRIHRSGRPRKQSA